MKNIAFSVALTLTLLMPLAVATEGNSVATQTSSRWCNSIVAPRAVMRPAGKARRPRISGIFEGGATRPDGMQRRSNADGVAPRAARALTAAQVIDRIKANVGVPWMTETVDTFKAGDPSTPITGVAVTMMATFDVLQRAAAANRNLIVTHEPTFYGHQDQTTDLESEKDPTFKAKQDFIAKNHLVVWRFHDHWHRRRPDGILAGMVHALGWESNQRPDNPSVFTMQETTLQALAADIRTKLDARTLRVVGDRNLKVTTVALSPGFAGYPNNRRLLQMSDVQVVVIGEAHEWEAIEHAADASAAGLPKALIAIGHIPSEQAGMEECARWLRTFVTEVPVDFVPAKDPFWQP